MDYLKACEQASYEQLSELIGTSTMTVRREVAAMENQELVIKTPGGVRLFRPHRHSMYESHIRERLTQNRREKQAIATTAADLLSGMESVFLDGGTTILELARAFASEKSGHRFVTNSLLVSSELLAAGHERVTLLGGDYCSESAAFTGQIAEENARSFFYDAAVFSTKGVVVGEGTFESSPENFRVKQIVAPRASKVFLLADHSKFGVRALRKVLDFSAIHCVVTDAKTPLQTIEAMRGLGVEVVVSGMGVAPATA